MTKTTHTKGPWGWQFASATESGMAIYLNLPNGAVTIEKEREANARLIIAAPTMLKKLKEAAFSIESVGNFQGNEVLIKQARELNQFIETIGA